jgi:hypothetical protein
MYCIGDDIQQPSAGGISIDPGKKHSKTEATANPDVFNRNTHFHIPKVTNSSTSLINPRQTHLSFYRKITSNTMGTVTQVSAIIWIPSYSRIF